MAKDDGIFNGVLKRIADNDPTLVECLDLEDQELNQQDIKMLAEGLAENNRCLKLLSLKGNALDDDSAIILSRAIARNGIVKTLYLGKNNISGQGATALAALNLFCLGLNQTPNIDKASFLKIARTSKCTEFFIGWNDLDDEVLRAFGANRDITQLGLIQTKKASIDGVRAVTKSASLQVLLLGQNPQLGNDMVDAIADSKTLISVGVADCGLDNSAALRLAEKSTTLTSIYWSSSNPGKHSNEILTAATSLKLEETLAQNRENSVKFLQACAAGNVVLITQMLKAGLVSPLTFERTYAKFEPEKGDTRETGLHKAVRHGKPEVISLLLKVCPALANRLNKDHQTAEELARAIQASEDVIAACVIPAVSLAAQLRPFAGAAAAGLVSSSSDPGDLKEEERNFVM